MRPVGSLLGLSSSFFPAKFVESTTEAVRLQILQHTSRATPTPPETPPLSVRRHPYGGRRAPALEEKQTVYAINHAALAAVSLHKGSCSGCPRLCGLWRHGPGDPGAASTAIGNHWLRDGACNHQPLYRLLIRLVSLDCSRERATGPCPSIRVPRASSPLRNVQCR